MIKITIKGSKGERTISFRGIQLLNKLGSQERGSILPPKIFFSALVKNKLSWEIDYLEATEFEKGQWQPMDIIFRILQTLENRLPVKIGEKEYYCQEGDDIQDTVAKIFAAVKESCEGFRLSSDDEKGLVITLV